MTSLRNLRPFALLTLFFVATTLPLVQASPSDEGQQAASREKLLEKVVVTGASVSAGWGLDAEVGVAAPLAVSLASVLGLEEIQSRHQAYFYNKPREHGAKLIERVLEDEPSLVIALDFLFWYGVGSDKVESGRLASFEEGLQQLGRVQAPLVVGDIPDISAALDGHSPLVNGPLVYSSMLPKPDTLAALNQRLHAWASERGNVTVVPMADALRSIRAGQSFQVRAQSWPAGSFETLIQTDKLHTTLEGTLAVSMLVADELCKQHELSHEGMCWNVEQARAGVMKRLEPELERKRERERKRRERKEKRRAKEAQGAGGGQ